MVRDGTFQSFRKKGEKRCSVKGRFLEEWLDSSSLEGCWNKALSERRVDEGGEERQVVARDGLEKGGRDGVKGACSGMVRHYGTQDNPAISTHTHLLGLHHIVISNKWTYSQTTTCLVSEGPGKSHLCGMCGRNNCYIYILLSLYFSMAFTMPFYAVHSIHTVHFVFTSSVCPTGF